MVVEHRKALERRKLLKLTALPQNLSQDRYQDAESGPDIRKKKNQGPRYKVGGLTSKVANSQRIRQTVMRLAGIPSGISQAT
jgi:hypothetical protein